MAFKVRAEKENKRNS